jgi:hypothetical protein
LSAGEFVARVVDDFVGLEPGCGVGAETVDFAGKNHQDENQECLHQQGDDEAAVGKDAEGGFSGEARAGAGEGGADVGGELLPARRPLDEELGSVVEGDEFFELESFGHGGSKVRNSA